MRCRPESPGCLLLLEARGLGLGRWRRVQVSAALGLLLLGVVGIPLAVLCFGCSGWWPVPPQALLAVAPPNGHLIQLCTVVIVQEIGVDLQEMGCARIGADRRDFFKLWNALT